MKEELKAIPRPRHAPPVLIPPLGPTNRNHHYNLQDSFEITVVTKALLHKRFLYTEAKATVLYISVAKLC
jgi:hypothetical protein